MEKSFLIMKKAILFFLLISGSAVFAEVHMTRVDPALFIHQPQTDFNAVSVQDEALKKNLIEQLFNADLLDHFGTHAYSTDAKFDVYYKSQQMNFWLMDLNADGTPEIVFSGKSDPSDEREFFEIYTLKSGAGKRLCREIGHLLAYKTNPNTNEVLLYHHQYPCCANASHNINRLRLINGKLQQLRYYFIAQEKNLLGSFFPGKSNFETKHKIAKKGFELNWSPEVITENAWRGRTDSNRIAKFDSLTVYVELARKKGWSYILVKNAPVAETGNRVINTGNFTETYIFGWTKREDLNN